jgi:hypothetical protein
MTTQQTIIQEDKYSQAYFLQGLTIKIDCIKRDKSVSHQVVTSLEESEAVRALKICDDQGMFDLEGFVGCREYPLEHIRRNRELPLSARARIETLDYCSCASHPNVNLPFSDYIALGKPKQIRVKFRREITL